MKTLIKHSFFAASALALFASPGLSSAGSAPADLAVSSSVTASCTITTSPVAFGAYDFVVNASSPLDNTGTVHTTCSVASLPVVTLGQGANAGGGSTAAVPVRRMSNGAGTPAFMSYNLYQDVDRLILWGNTTLTAPSAVAGTGTNADIIVYGRVAAGQSLPVAVSYADTVVATVTF